MIHTIAGFNLVLGAIGFVWLLIRTARRQHEYPTEVLLLLYMTIALFAGLLATSVDQYVLNEGSIVNAVVITSVKLFAIVVLIATRTTKYRTGTRQDDGNPGADQNEDVP